MEQFCDPRHFLDLFDHIRPISMQNEIAKEIFFAGNGRGNEWTENPCTRTNCAGCNYLSKKRRRDVYFPLLVQECVPFQNSLPKRWMQGFVSLESVTGIKSAYSQNECTFPAARGLSLPAFCEDKQTILRCHTLVMMLTHIRKLFEIHPKIFHRVLNNPNFFIVVWTMVMDTKSMILLYYAKKIEVSFKSARYSRLMQMKKLNFVSYIWKHFQEQLT